MSGAPGLEAVRKTALESWLTGQAALRAVLKDITRARLAVSNPKRLAADRQGDERRMSGR